MPIQPVRGRKRNHLLIGVKDTQMENGISDGIIGELTEVGVGKKSSTLSKRPRPVASLPVCTRFAFQTPSGS